MKLTTLSFSVHIKLLYRLRWTSRRCDYDNRWPTSVFSGQ